MMESVVIGFICITFGVLIGATSDMLRARRGYQKARDDMRKAEAGFNAAKEELNKHTTIDTLTWDCCGSTVAQGHKESCIYTAGGGWSYRD